ncbi:DUF4190 domain-containing protein [Streptomyces sp. NBC_01013]|uniref:DUF4190 domain-containing protein n=1 Tax=Streptomyces sp. NBC_01013 TaxID=2903718 RepID=UPI00387012F4|nr:DUF4190 domain-containing protein [Streptomyces sp. NBC_01013]
MSDSSERPAEGSAPRDPWAPPENRVPLEKNTGDPRLPSDGATGEPRPPAVHDQQTVTSMPNAGTGPIPAAGFGPPDQGQPAGPGAWQDPGSVPPPPVGPNGPGQPTPPPVGQYGYPAPPQPQYGYPAPPVPQYGDYPGYPGYGQNAWGGPGPANGMGIASLVLGIISVAGFCMYGLGIILGVLALIFGLIGRGRVTKGEANNGGVALAGIILGSIGIVVSAAFLGFFIWAVTNDDLDSDSGSIYEGTSLVLDAAHQ